MIPDIAQLRSLRWRMTRVLLWFSIGSIVGGTAIVLLSHEGWTDAIGWQFAIWGGIDLIFALMGVRQCSRAKQGLLDDLAEAESLRKSLRFNGGLNWLWVALGTVLIAWGAATASTTLVGHGIGVLLQGGFLFFFDRLFLRKLSRLLDPPGQLERV